MVQEWRVKWLTFGGLWESLFFPLPDDDPKQGFLRRSAAAVAEP